MPSIRFVVLLPILLVQLLHVPASQAEEVRIIRDPWGVPHVFASSNHGVGYGYGWAIGEDRLEEALSAMWTANGRRTEIEGAGAVDIDRTFRLMRIAEFIEAGWDRYPDSVKQIGEGYADGLNAYMAAHPDEVPEWAEPVKPSWGFAVGRLVNFWPTLGNVNGERRGLAPSLATLDFGMSDKHWNPVGSNGWAVAADRTAGGAAFIAADPHMPWKHEFRLYEVHLKSDEIDFAGAGFIGTPMPVFGRTPHVGWTWTANRPDHGDVYKLELNPENPEQYRFGDGWRDFESREITYELPDGSNIEETIRWSVHGPVTRHDPAEGMAVAYWISAYGLEDPPVQFYEMVTAKDLDELEQAMSLMQFASFNMVAADSAGDVLYVNGGRVPRRPEGIQARRPLDGSDPSLVWTEMIPWSELPAVRRPANGWVQNCNNDPSTTTGTEIDPTPESYAPGTVKPSRKDDTVRAWYLRKLLEAETNLDAERAREITADVTMIPHGPIRDRLDLAWKDYAGDYPDRSMIERDVRDLLAWDGQPDVQSPLPTLFLLWLYMYADQAMVSVDFLERSLDSLDSTDAFRMFDTLRDARKRIGKLLPFGSDLPWGLAHVIRKAGRTFSVQTGMYPAISLMNANADLRGSDLSKMQCTIGSAYVAVHEMSDPPRSWTVTPIGQTDRRDRPYVRKITEVFAQGELKPFPLTLDQLAEHETTETVIETDR